VYFCAREGFYSDYGWF
nr:immunoglobulin heavy chain junction region [Mus musculus]